MVDRLLPTSDPEMRQRFETAEEFVRRLNFSRAATLALIFMIAGSSLDYVVMPDHLWDFMVIRWICAAGLGVMLLLLRAKIQGGVQRLVGHMVAFLPLSAILMMIALGGDRAETYYAGLCLVQFGASLLLRWSTLDSAINAAISVGGYLAVAVPFMSDQRIVFNNAYFLFVSAVFACAGTYFYNGLRFNDFKLREELRLQQEELADSHQKLKALNEAKTRFFANVSHELRTPLTLILGPIEQLRRSLVVARDPRTSELVTLMEEHGLRLLRLINDLLDLVRIDSDVMPMRKTPIDVESFVDGMADGLRPTAEAKQIAIRSAFTTDSNTIGLCDRDRLEKMVLNLAINAIKFTPRGGTIDLRASVKQGVLTLEIRDTGRGISEADLPHVFERFWQGDMTARRKQGGVGIGLSLVQSFAESLDGTIGVTSVEGKGSVFTIILPWTTDGDVACKVSQTPENEDTIEMLQRRARLSGVIDQDDRSSPVSFEEGASDRLGLPKILIADDEPGLRQYLAASLADYQVIEARDGKEALELARQYQPELAILDYMMPEMDGIEIARHLRQLPMTARMPIMLVTANAENTPRMLALEAGVNDFLTKPFSTVELIVRAGNLIEHARHERDLAISKRDLEVVHEELKENEARLLQSERLSALGRMSAGIIHEVNNPLNYAKQAIHTLKSFAKPMAHEEREDFEDILKDAAEGVDRVVRIVSDLRSFTKGNPSAMSHTSLHDVVESARRLVSNQLHGIQLDIHVPEECVVMGNDNQLCQVFVNLIQNSASFVTAAEARGEKPTIKVRGEATDEGLVRISVWDNGCGIAAADLANVFDPFFTKRDVGEGMGLGLSICHQILKAHDAEVEVTSEQHRFTEFSLCFPPPTSRIKPTILQD
jgi:signal transduction histidine kinase